MTNRRRWAAWGAIVLLGSLSAACSDGDGAKVTTQSDETTTSGSLSLAEWQRATTAVCEEHLPALRETSEALPEEASVDEFVAMLDELMPSLDRFLADLDAVGIPDERSADVSRLHELNAIARDATERAIAAADADDEEAMYDALTPLEGPNEDVEELYLDLGVPACVDERDGVG